MSDTLGMIAAALLTLAILTRVWRVNISFRIAEYILLGVLAGYVAAVALRDVLFPGLLTPLLADPLGQPVLLFSLLMALLLGLRFVTDSALRNLGLLPLGILLGAGGALALAGAARGTLAPQLLAASELSFFPAGPDWLSILAVLVSTLVTVAVLIFLFQRQPDTGAMPKGWLKSLSYLGYLAVMIALGALLASTAGARVVLLIDRVQYFLDLLRF
ncbi:MAG: hypothetical protein J5I90_02800 [Caldilineales bacterium]|nr:hypothetical protein [Caldilineales bacterium]